MQKIDIFMTHNKKIKEMAFYILLKPMSSGRWHWGAHLEAAASISAHKVGHGTKVVGHTVDECTIDH